MQPLVAHALGCAVNSHSFASLCSPAGCMPVVVVAAVVADVVVSFLAE